MLAQEFEQRLGDGHAQPDGASLGHKSRAMQLLENLNRS